MIALITFGIAVLLGVVLSRASTGDISPGERVYLLLTPLPVFVALVLPTIIGMAQAASLGRSPGSNRLTVAGAALSGMMILVGVAFAIRRRRLGRMVDARLVVGMALAAMPLFLIALVAMLYAAR